MEPLKETVFYNVVDALQVRLNEMPDGRVRGFETKKVKIGPWALDADVTVMSDILTPTTISFYVKVMGNLWLYVIDNAVGLSAIVFDGSAVKMHVKDCASFGGKSVLDTLNKLKAGIVTSYYFDEATMLWTENASKTSDLVQQPPAQSTVKSLPSPTAAT